MSEHTERQIEILRDAVAREVGLPPSLDAFLFLLPPSAAESPSVSILPGGQAVSR